MYDDVYHTPLGRFSQLDCSTTKRVPIPNDTSSASSRRAVSNAEILGDDTIPTAEISTLENRPRGVRGIHRAVVNGIHQVLPPMVAWQLCSYVLTSAGTGGLHAGARCSTFRRVLLKVRASDGTPGQQWLKAQRSS